MSKAQPSLPLLLQKYLELKMPLVELQSSRCYGCNPRHFYQREFDEQLRHTTEFLLQQGWTKEEVSYWFTNFSLDRVNFDVVNEVLVLVPGACITFRDILSLVDICAPVRSYIDAKSYREISQQQSVEPTQIAA